MALRLRRGTDLQRQAIVIDEGELIYITDTKELYAGDGITLGGILITGDVAGSPAVLTRDLNLNGFDILGTGTITSNFVGDGSGLNGIILDQLDDVLLMDPGAGDILKYIDGFWTNAPETGGGVGTGVIDGQQYSISIQGDVVGQDSNVIVDATTNTFYGNFVNPDGSNFTITNGSLLLSGTRTYTSISSPVAGELMYDDSTEGYLYVYTGEQWTKLVAEGITGNATLLETFLQFGNKTTAERDVFGTDSNTIDGAIFYNTDSERVEIFQAGSWVKFPNNGTTIGEVLTWNGNEWLATPPASGGTVVSADQLNGFNGTYYLDFNNHNNTPTTLAGYGITDAALATDLGNFTFTGSVLDTNDSGDITITPTVTFSSDVTVENDLIVTNKITVDTLEVNTLITTPSAGTPEIASDGAILLTAGTRVEVTQSPFKIASFTSTARDLLSAENGDLIYNSTTNIFQGYANGVWVDLH